jgi:hypothetical protein
MSIYQARYNNAKRIAEQINDLIDKDYLIFDEDKELLEGKFIITDKDISLNWGKHCKIAYFVNDSQFDNGALDTIEKYNSKFKDWRVVHPSDIQKFEL